MYSSGSNSRDEDYYFSLYNRLARCRSFLKWTKTAEYRVWLFLQSYIIRSNKIPTGRINIYKNFYMKGVLAARWSLEDIAKAVDIRSAEYVSRLLGQMEEKGLIKIHKIRVGKSTLNVYEFGTHDFNGKESLYVDLYFTRKRGQEIINKYKN
jgi:hypothetical protein